MSSGCSRRELLKYQAVRDVLERLFCLEGVEAQLPTMPERTRVELRETIYLEREMLKRRLRELQLMIEEIRRFENDDEQLVFDILC